MKHRTDNENLLTDVLSEATPSELRDALLEATLHEARRRRYWRRTRHAVTLAVAFGMIGFFAWRYPRPVNVPPVIVEENCRIIATQPLRADAIITTRHFDPSLVVLSAITTSVLETRFFENEFRIIDDEELLALVAPRAAALVRLEDHSEQLIFINPDDENGFPVN